MDGSFLYLKAGVSAVIDFDDIFVSRRKFFIKKSLYMPCIFSNHKLYTILYNFSAKCIDCIECIEF